MPRIGIIIAILYVLFHVAQMILQASAKRKEQERIRLEAERRRLAAGQMSSPKTMARVDDGTGTGDVVPRMGPAPVPQPPRAGRPADDLAARRRAQLEELRTKREGRRTSTAATPIRPGTSVPIPTSQRSATIPPQVAREDRTRIRELEQQRLKREDELRRQQMEAQASMRRKDTEEARHAAEQVRRQVQEQRASSMQAPPAAATRASSTPTASIARSVKSPTKAAIVEMLRTPNSMRQALILKELLDKPLALRNP